MINLPPIYANNKNSYALSNCRVSSVYLDEEQTKYIAYCDISDKELNYFDDYSKKENKMLYNVLCDQRATMDLVVYKLDTNLYPSIYVKYFLISDIAWSQNTIVSLLTNIELLIMIIYICNLMPLLLNLLFRLKLLSKKNSKVIILYLKKL